MKKIESDAISLSSECLRRFWQKDLDFVLQYFSDDVMWIGAQHDEFLLDFETTKADLAAAVAEIPPCVLLNAEFHATSCGSKSCTVIGTYLTTTDKTADFFLQNVQRCTFVWEKTSDGMKIRHLHVSNPLGELQLAEMERFPVTMGKMAQVYMQRQIQRLTDSRRITVPGENGSTYVLSHADILYLSAFSKDTIITTYGGEFLVKKGISELQKLLDAQFFPIHRSHIVNFNFVASLERYTITMIDGEKLPIPQKKFNEIRAALHRFYASAEAK